MICNVFGWTLNLAQSINLNARPLCSHLWNFMQDSEAVLCARCRQMAADEPGSTDNKQVKMYDCSSYYYCDILSFLCLEILITFLNSSNRKWKKKVNLYSRLLCRVFKAFRYSLCETRGSHSFTCHPHTNHTCLYSPAAGRHYHLTGTHCTYPWRDGQAELTWVAGYIWIVPDMTYNVLSGTLILAQSIKGALAWDEWKRKVDGPSEEVSCQLVLEILWRVRWPDCCW